MSNDCLLKQNLLDLAFLSLPKRGILDVSVGYPGDMRPVISDLVLRLDVGLVELDHILIDNRYSRHFLDRATLYELAIQGNIVRFES